MLTPEFAAWGWYRHQWPYLLQRAQLELRQLFGYHCDDSLEYLEQLFERPHERLRLRPSLASFAAALKKRGTPAPMKGLSVSAVVTVSEAQTMRLAMAGHEASSLYRKLIMQSLLTTADKRTYKAMEAAMAPLLTAGTAFMRQAVSDQVAGPTLVSMLINFRYQLLIRFWLEAHNQHNPMFLGLETLRESGAFVMWYYGGHAIAMIADNV